MPTTIDPTLLSLLTQGGFAALFIWLLIDTRNTNAKREDMQMKREDKLTEMLDAYAKNLPSIADTLRRIEERLGRIEEGRK